jgi:hypothetical protein
VGETKLTEVRIFLTAEDASLARNGNYGDASGSSYSWDTTVANHALPQAGDLVVLRSKQSVLGVSLLTKVEKQPSWKTRLRCPNCLSTKLKWSSRQEAFRCGPCKNMISTPNSEFLSGIDSYHARYDWFFTPLQEVSLPQVKQISKTPIGQQSIQTASLASLLSLLPKEALWRLGYSRLGEQYLRADQFSVGRASTAVSRSGGNCAISGITSTDRLVRFDFISYSTKNSQVLLEGTCEVLDVLAAQLELGHCIVNQAEKSIVIPELQGLPTMSFPLQPKREDVRQWLSLFSGQINN